MALLVTWLGSSCYTSILTKGFGTLNPKPMGRGWSVGLRRCISVFGRLQGLGFMFGGSGGCE